MPQLQGQGIRLSGYLIQTRQVSVGPDEGAAQVHPRAERARDLPARGPEAPHSLRLQSLSV